MLGKLFGGGKTKTKTVEIAAPLAGKLVPLAEVPDEAFSQGFMGPGAAIEPASGTVTAPFDGTIGHLIDTGHAVVVEHESGLELLIHVGINTVEMKGEGFKPLVRTGDSVKKGQPLIEVDLERIREAGYSVVTPIVVANEDLAESVDSASGNVAAQAPAILTVHLKSGK
ncbi:PTS glucose transporter subunit IIA [Paenibacillus sp. PR3]|uniref:PTS glucose transporter subunit IIA n=1 Tax=Paenibacillus terricola TaxID=2763503 RepID=A0ABR8N1G9_9BACL|nr:PTS glucose transporter subunit IIA [Paenibacillus terricola]MBD3922025.1 PTS glucose transporter subunit IIA [Paenibacillus terricola]